MVRRLCKDYLTLQKLPYVKVEYGGVYTLCIEIFNGQKVLKLKFVASSFYPTECPEIIFNGTMVQGDIVRDFLDDWTVDRSLPTLCAVLYDTMCI